MFKILVIRSLFRLTRVPPSGSFASISLGRQIPQLDLHSTHDDVTLTSREYLLFSRDSKRSRAASSSNSEQLNKSFLSPDSGIVIEVSLSDSSKDARREGCWIISVLAQ